MPFACTTGVLTPVPRLVESPAPPADENNKRKAKVRSAWISFAGRIVAQLVGAAATVGFALVVLQKAPAPASQPVVAPVSQPIGIGARPAGHSTIAVLPFHVFAGESKETHIADAFTDLLVTDLARAGGISVVSSTSSMRYKGQSLALPEIAHQLGASYIVEGSLTISGAWARINAQLINAATDEHIWARSYQQPIDDLLGLQDTVAADIAREVQGLLGQSVQTSAIR